MIHVKRLPTPASLDGPDSAGGKETKLAIAAQRLGNCFEHKAYKADDVVKTLRSMFNKKCAYCEFPYAAGGPEDIEHFRPKGAVVISGRLVKRGYYWLGAEWTNLLPSCIDCNRKRQKEFPNIRVAVSGKANLFPVVDEKRRWRSHRAKCAEAPLLLNPCEEQPHAHLEFIKDGLVRPVRTAGKDSKKGEVSIEVYGLLRSDLVEQRRQKELKVRAAIERALKASELADSEPNATRRMAMDLLAKDLLSDAEVHLAVNEPYLAVAQMIFREYGLR